MAETQQGTQTEASGAATDAPASGGTIALLKTFIEASVNRRKELIDNVWKTNVNFRVQRPWGGTNADDQTVDRVASPEDWSRTKQKTAQLMFKLPKIIAKACRPEFRDKQAAVTSLVNTKLRKEVKAYYMIDECLADVINAAGLMVSCIGLNQYDRVVDVPDPTWQAEVPDETWQPEVIDEATGAVMPNPEPQGMVPNPVKQRVDQITQVLKKCFYWNRLSPASFLWPTDFTGSHWDQAPWLGYETWMLIEEAKKTFKNFPANYKPVASRPVLLSEDLQEKKSAQASEQWVKLQIIWYRAALYDSDAYHPDHLRKVVFLDGHDTPLEQGDTTWQKWVDPVDPVAPVPANPGNPALGIPATPEQPGSEGTPGYYMGLTKFPIRVETLTYVSDLAVPPSDSEAGRPQVRELMKSRSQMLRQRDMSIPIRWYDSNRLDELIADGLRDGTWQDMIPTNGPGDRVIGEVARAQYPRENFQFQQVLGGDLDRSWSLSNNQLSSLNSTDRSATEVNAVQSAGQVRLDYEKERVNRYISEGAAVLFSLMQLFMEGKDYVEVVGEGGAKELVEMSRADIVGAHYEFEFVPDSSDRVSIETKQANALKLFNLLGNSPTVNRPRLEEQIMELHGADPAELVVEAKEKGPEPPNISYRFGGEDLLNPMVVAIMMKAGHGLTPQDIGSAAMMIQDSIKQMMLAKSQLNPQNLGGQPMPPTQPTPGGNAPPPELQSQVTPPETNPPILKRAEDGTHLT